MMPNTDLVEKIYQNFCKIFKFKVHQYPNPIGLWSNEQKSVIYYSLESDLSYPFLEIGSFFGGSASLMMLSRCELNENDLEPSIICIDKEPTYLASFNKNLSICGFSKHIERIQIDSKDILQQIKDKQFSLIFIDGWHSYKHAIMDFENTFNNLTHEGYMLFHDTAQLNSSNLQHYLDLAKKNHDIWINESPDIKKQTYNVTEACAYLYDKYKESFDLLDLPEVYRNRNSITCLKKK